MSDGLYGTLDSLMERIGEIECYAIGRDHLQRRLVEDAGTLAQSLDEESIGVVDHWCQHRTATRAIESTAIVVAGTMASTLDVSEMSTIVGGLIFGYACVYFIRGVRGYNRLKDGIKQEYGRIQDQLSISE